MTELTLADKRRWLVTHGYSVGVRDPRLNTNYSGRYMVADTFEEGEYELPTKDGSNGPWCIVGDDFDALVTQAFDVHFADAELSARISAKG